MQYDVDTAVKTLDAVRTRFLLLCVEIDYFDGMIELWSQVKS